MNNYIYDIKVALILFPLVALLICIPFILTEYHKYGSISFSKSILTYSFSLYILCTYLLVILPLPDKNEVVNLTTPRIQLIPFEFIVDIIKNFRLNIDFLKSAYIYVPLFNIIMTIPFGIYMRYYFGCNLKKTLLYTFILSLFFELTQLSGLYFIYPRGYRLCDIDDILLNILGGFCGYTITPSLVKNLPSINKINKKAKEQGKNVSGLKRTTSLLLDIFICFIIFLFIYIWQDNTYLLLGTILIIYYILIPTITKGSTLAQKWLNLKVVDYNNNFNILRIIIRDILFILIYIAIPLLTLYTASNLSIINDIVTACIICLIYLLIVIFYIYIMIKYLFSKSLMLYEKISKTKLISTIKE